MKDISLKDLLESGCHFGHRIEKWHPKAAEYIYQDREGIHIIDLAQTRSGLKKAAEYLRNLGKEGKIVLFLGTKRQARGVVSEAAKKANAPYLSTRWIGGFMTNWEEIKKNIDKLNRMHKERTDGDWTKFPKHEVVKLEKDLRKIEAVYGGVASLVSLPDTLFIVDIKKEIAALKEASKQEIPVVAIVDTNTDPNLVDYPIPANDDAVGSIRIIVDYLADAYLEGKKLGEKAASEGTPETEKKEVKEEVEKETKTEKKEEKPKKPLDKIRGKRGRPKKMTKSP